MSTRGVAHSDKHWNHNEIVQKVMQLIIEHEVTIGQAECVLDEARNSMKDVRLSELNNSTLIES